MAGSMESDQMTVKKTEPQTSNPTPTKPQKDRATEIANTFEWLITAFILAFVFRAFVMEAFRIPTGSMADTLMGAHFRVSCQECGYEYERGYVPQVFGFPADYVPKTRTSASRVHCPSCGFSDAEQVVEPLKLLVSNGDRILVLKCLYQFMEPKRWDVIVFKNPTNPQENYIKRLVGLPGETLEIVDGDLFVNGEIARKPAMVQRELWMPVYDNDYQPIHPDLHAFNRSPWENPFNTQDSLWQIDPQSPTRFVLDSPDDQIQSMSYGAPSANDFKTLYAYNSPYRHRSMPICSDLQVRFHATSQGSEGFLGAQLGKYGKVYQGRVYADGTLSIAQLVDGQSQILAHQQSEALTGKHTTEIRFCLVDQRLILDYGQSHLAVDLDGSIETRKQRLRVDPTVAIQGAGQWSISHVALCRDIHYTDEETTPRKVFRALEDHPFKLNQDEFFVLGDNSPNSEDARWWEAPTLSSRGYDPPRAGIVPRNYLVGKAMFVYWPSGFQFPWPQALHNWVENDSNTPWMRLIRAIVRLRWIPNIGKMRYIYGGSNPVETVEAPGQA